LSNPPVYVNNGIARAGCRGASNPHWIRGHLHRAPRGSGLDIRQARFLDASIRIIPITRIFRKGRTPQILLSGSRRVVASPEVIYTSKQITQICDRVRVTWP
jgi:hypothetical protein